MGGRHRQLGQAMIETIVAAGLVLVPLFLAIPVIAKYQDIRSHVVQGARYAAWERTVWFGGDAAEPNGGNKWDANEKSDDVIRQEVGARILSRTAQKFNTSADSGSGSSYIGGSKPLWTDRRGNTLLRDYSDVSNAVDNEKAPGLINDALTPLMTISSIVSNFTLDTHALYTANIGLSVKEVAFNTNRSGLGPCAGCPVDYIATSNNMNFQDKNVIVANGWSANGPGAHSDLGTVNKDKITVYRQVRGMTPTSIFKPENSSVFKVLLDVLDAIALVFFPELSTLDLGRLEVDRVPPDRLQ